MLEALDRFSSAVLTTVDDHGYPSSVRVEPRITSDATVEVDPPA
ncbi:MAG: hypothetical protein R3290_11355 [Acidimicrobiia bacterium]|nr:hypothetical protein [Acidimicrobiia bacterium]